MNDSVLLSQSSELNGNQSRIARGLLEARRELIDLTRRNRLLHTPRTGSRPHCLEIVEADSDDLFVALTRENKHFPFLSGPELSTEETLRAETEIKPAIGSRANALQTTLDPEKLERRLLKLFHETRTFEEEQGVSILFLAIGFLNWFEDDRSETASCAPLLLIPVTLERRQGRDPFVLRGRDDDLIMNVSLAEKLRGEFGITLPETPDSEDWLPTQYLATVSTAVAGQNRWSVDYRGIGLGFFTFSKFLMWRDLDSAAWPNPSDLLMHGLVRRLLGEEIPETENLTPLVSDEEAIDQHIDIASATHVVDADSSQAVCIEEIRRGRNLVIQGPPGTGKSQTITNIIAAAVKEGKSVLFVAEKAAALEVVSGRLKGVGLEPLCLEIHSKKATKASIIQSLERALRENGAILQGGRNASELRAARDRLNALSAALHREIRSTGRTPYHVIGTILKLQAEGVRVFAERLQNAGSWEKARLDEVGQVMERTSAALKNLGPVPVEHPWFGTSGDGLTPLSEERLKAALEDGRKQLAEIFSLGAQAAAVLKTPSGCSVSDFRIPIQSLNVLAAVPEKGRENLRNENWKNAWPRVEQLSKNGKLWSSVRAELSSVLTEDAWSTDTSSTRDVIAKNGSSIFRFFSGNYRRAIAELKNLYRDKPPKNRQQQIAILDELFSAQLGRKKLIEDSELGRAALGFCWAETETDWEAVDRLLNWSNTAGQLNPSLIELGSTIDDQLCGTLARNLHKAVDAFQGAFAKVTELVRPDIQTLFSVADLERADLNLVCAVIDRWIAGLSSFDNWARARELLEKLDALDLRVVTDQLRTGGIAPDEAVRMVELLVAEGLWDVACEDDRELKAIDGDERTRLVNSFRELDRKRIEFARSEVLSTYLSRRPDGNMGEMAIVRNEIGKKRRHLPIRKLMEKAGLAVQKLKPVFLMSPMSVAEFLPPGRLNFDLVVIDEASQVRPEEAFGVIARGRQLVVVGDSKQLPPTNFFRMISADDDEDGEEEEQGVNARVEDFESILKLFSSRGAHERMLRWHYRSKHPSLIALSNQNCYGGGLLLPPSPYRDREELGLYLEKTPAGHYERGGSGRNLVEADIIAQAVEKHLKERSTSSLGIACFSVAQREAIEEAIRRLGIGNEAESFAPKGERLFVKNLEAVQGDERDVMFISIGYGKDAEGQMYSNFGPLSKDGGERRLNVLISRARERCVVFSSITSADISADSKMPGTRMLRDFLHYAETGKMAAGQVTFGEFDSPFEEAVAIVLRDRGYKVEPQVGVSGFRIDLGILHPEHPGKFILGIECDGAAYHSSRSARDRDRLRQQVLEGLGWRLYRIWSTDWFRRKTKETERLIKAVEEALKLQAARRTQVPFTVPLKIKSEPTKALHVEVSNFRDFEPEPKPQFSSSDPKPKNQSVEALVEPYREYTTRSFKGMQLEDLAGCNLVEIVVNIVHHEGPIHLEEVARRLRQAFGLGRTGNRILSIVEVALKKAAENGALLREGEFWFRVGKTLEKPRSRRDAAAPLRRADRIAPQEYRLAIQAVLRQAFSVEKEEMSALVARLLGFDRTGNGLDRAISEEIDHMLKMGLLQDADGRLENRN